MDNDRAPDGIGPVAAEPSTSPSLPDAPPPTGLLPGSIVPMPPVRPAGLRRPAGFAVTVAIVLVAVLGGGALFVSGYALGQRTVDQPGTPAADAAAFQPFWDAYNAIRDRFALGPVSQKTVIEGAIRGMLDATGDPYSTYLSPDQYRSTLQDINGEFEGIGAEIQTVDASGAVVACSTFGPDCRLQVSNPLDGSPAEKAGIQPGDLITAVDGKSIAGLTPDAATNEIRGPKGTDVTLTIVRGSAAPFDVKVTRDVIQQQEVVAKDLADGTIGYIRLSGFSLSAGDSFVKALTADVQNGQTRIVVDLRGNPGGYVTAARQVASAFIASGPIFWEVDAQGHQTPTDALPDGVATDPKIKVAVLVDGGSASASEIVAGSLQDTGRATLIGQQSYGKGTVQEWIELADDTGAVKLTVAKWLTPDKRWIHGVGLTPDIKVDVPSDTPAGSDPTLDRAIEFLSGTSALPTVLRPAA